MLGMGGRQMMKRMLSLSRVKILYARVTLTRFTTIYFFIALFSCLALTVLQALTFVENATAVNVLAPIQNRPDTGLAILQGNQVMLCSALPNKNRTDCQLVIDFGRAMPMMPNAGNKTRLAARFHDENANLKGLAETDPSDPTANLGRACVASLKWLDDLLHDAKREDVVTLAFNVWLLVLALTTVLNESIPHLATTFLGHAMGTAWACFRVASTYALKDRYQKDIVPKACGGVDIMGGWWELRIQHSGPIAAVHGIALIIMAYLTFKLYKVYANQTFSRVGASPEIHRMYKLVLVFLVCLQLSAFFSLASTALWLDKICHGAIMHLVTHFNLYLAGFIVTLVMQLPWFFLGWSCVRKECKTRFLLFIGIAMILLSDATAMFFSPLYRYIFIMWPFFTTVTLVAFALVLTTSILSILCRLNFSKGLAHYFQVTEALEGVDFTPVNFSKDDDGDPEKNAKDMAVTDEEYLASIVNLPTMTYQQYSAKKARGSSIYSEKNISPIQLSSSPPLMSDIGSVPTRLASATRNRLSKAPPKRTESLAMKKKEAEDKAAAAAAMPKMPPGIATNLPPIQTSVARPKSSATTASGFTAASSPRTSPIGLTPAPRTPGFNSNLRAPSPEAIGARGLPFQPRKLTVITSDLANRF